MQAHKHFEHCPATALLIAINIGLPPAARGMQLLRAQRAASRAPPLLAQRSA